MEETFYVVAENLYVAVGFATGVGKLGIPRISIFVREGKEGITGALACVVVNVVREDFAFFNLVTSQRYGFTCVVLVANGVSVVNGRGPLCVKSDTIFVNGVSFKIPFSAVAYLVALLGFGFVPTVKDKLAVCEGRVGLECTQGRNEVCSPLLESIIVDDCGFAVLIGSALKLENHLYLAFKIRIGVLRVCAPNKDKGKYGCDYKKCENFFHSFLP